ncbi:MAG: metal-dependent hydrolase [Phycisphaerales bacterium]|nr:metal-dependent hydrolase [Phycisphaerales bacterium]
MDNITHILLGGAMAYAMAGKRAGKIAFFVGGLAATIPDLDVFVRTGDALWNHLMHRSFMHSLVIVPVLAAVAMLPFLRSAKVRGNWLRVYLAAMAACATHTILDMLTSYGTMILWPFSQRRFALDIVVIVDVFYTLILAIGVAVARRWKTAKGKWRVVIATLVLSTMYLGIDAMQHERAMAAQRELMALRGQTGAERGRVLPQIGMGMNYRSIYMYHGRIYADAIRVRPFAEVQVREGTSVEQVSADASREKKFWEFADGFVARMPGETEGEGTLGDMRYTLTPEGFDAIWGISADTGEWRNFIRRRMVGRFWRELVHPTGYLPLSVVHAGDKVTR